MRAAIGLTFMLATTYFGGSVMVFSSPPALFFLAGLVSLVVGVRLARKARDRRLWWLALSPIASELALVLAGLFWQTNNHVVRAIMLPGLPLAQLVFFLGLIIVVFPRNRAAARASLAFSVFGLTFGLTAGFIGLMAVTGDWL